MRNIPSFELFEATAPKALLQQFATSREAATFFGLTLVAGSERTDDGSPLAEGEWTLSRDRSRGGQEWYLTVNVGAANHGRVSASLARDYGAAFGKVEGWFKSRGRRASALTGDAPVILVQIS